jgi:cephalosporin-C deacetylase
MTSGITDPRDYYYRRVYTDAVRLLDAARALPEVDPDKIIVAGGSQGGGITVAAAALAALSGIQLVGSAPDVPFLCHFRRAVELTDRLPYGEISQYLAAWRDHADRAYATLAYFDGAVLGRLASAPTLFSVALMDPICPPSTVFAAYHAYGADAPDPVFDKEIRVYGHNGHEGGGPYQIDAQLDWFAARFAAANVSS